MYSQTFRINLKNTDGFLLSPSEADTAANQRSTYTSVGVLGGSPSLVKKHGDIVTLYGQEALHLKRLIEAGMAPSWEIYTAPIVVEVTTDDLTVSSLNCHAYGTIVSGGSTVTEYGFVYAANTNVPTIENNKLVVGSEAFSGSFDDSVFLDLELDGVDLSSGDNPVWFAAYATNSNGTVYGDVLQTDPNPMLCLMEGTMVSLSRGRYKRIEDIIYKDNLLVWNFDKAKLDYAKPVWIMKPFKSSRYSLVKFSDGSELGTIDDGKGHSIFNLDKGMFTHMMSEDTPIGTTTYSKNGERIKVVNKKIINKETTFYNVVTNIHMNMFTNNILTSTGLNNIYPIDDMKFIKDNKTNIENIKELQNIPDELFAGLRLAEQRTNVKAKVLRMIKNQS